MGIILELYPMASQASYSLGRKLARKLHLGTRPLAVLILGSFNPEIKDPPRNN